MREILAEITIDAPVETVWDILVDFPEYANWNPFISQISGTPEPGEKLEVFIQPPGSKGMSFHPRVLIFEPKRELRWLGRVFLPGIFDGEHIFQMEPVGESTTRFIQREKFTGLLVPFLWKSLDTNTRRGFHAMNEALKVKAEQAAGAGELHFDHPGEH